MRRRKGKRRVLWHLAGNGKQERTKDEDKPLKTGSRFKTGSQKSKNPRIGLVDRKEKTYPVENKPVPVSPPPVRARGNRFLGTGLHSGAKEVRKPASQKPPPDSAVRLNHKTDRRDGNPTGVCPSGKIRQSGGMLQLCGSSTENQRCPSVIKGANRSSPAPCCVTAPISTRTTFGLLLPESAFSCAWHTACGRCGRPGFLIDSMAFPPGISVVRATLPEEG